MAGHTARQWTELDRKDAGGVGDTRPPSGRGLCTETQDAHARHRSPRGDTPDPLEPHKNSTPCLALLASPGRFHHHHRPCLHPTHPPPEEDCVPRSTRRPETQSRAETWVPSLHPSESWKPHGWEPGPGGVLTQTRPSVQPQQWPSSQHQHQQLRVNSEPSSSRAQHN